MLNTLKSYLPFFIGLVSGIYFFNLNVVTLQWTHVPGDLGDARFNNYLLEHVHQFITGKTHSFWNAPFLYPEENVITYSDNLLGSAPFYSLFRLMGLNPDTSFQCWFIFISVLNYTACYFLLLYLFKDKYAAVLGAMIFAFSIALQSQMVHAQTFPRYAVPLALLMGIMYFKELNPSFFFGALFFLVYQFYCGLYLGFMLFVPLTLLLLLSIIFKWKMYALCIKKMKWWIWMLLAILINVALLLPLMLPYLERAQQLDLYSYEKILQTVPTLRSFFYSHYGSLFWEFLKNTGVKYEAFWDHEIFAGGVAVLCFIAFTFIVLLKVFKKKMLPRIEVNDITALIFFTGLFTFLFFIRVQGHSLYKLIHPLPGFASMRAIQRIINIELVFFAIAVAFIFNLLFRQERKYKDLLFLFFVWLIYADNHIHPDTTDRFEMENSRQRISYVKKKIEGLKAGSIISYEPDTLIGGATFYQLDAMLASQSCGMRTLNGYTSNSPLGYSFYWTEPNEYNRLRWLQQKKLSPDSVVVIH